jgi:hypothetical protein
MTEPEIVDHPRQRQIPAKKVFTFLSVIFILAIYTGSGAVRELSTAIRQIAGARLDVLVTAGLVVILALLLVYCRSALRIRNLPFLILVISGYGLAIWYLRVPEERFHLLQYGLADFFIACALPDKISGLRRHLAAIALASLVGIGDELIQALRPNRVGDLRDVLINGYAAVLAQGLLVILTGKNVPEEKPMATPSTLLDQPASKTF